METTFFNGGSNNCHERSVINAYVIHRRKLDLIKSSPRRPQGLNQNSSVSKFRPSTSCSRNSERTLPMEPYKRRSSIESWKPRISRQTQLDTEIENISLLQRIDRVNTSIGACHPRYKSMQNLTPTTHNSQLDRPNNINF